MKQTESLMSNARAFTLLELCIATVLSTVLMIGVLAVVMDLRDPALIASSDDAVDESANPTLRRADEEAAVDAWVRLLREDLDHAVVIDAVEPGRIAMIGYGALNGRCRRRVHRPVRIVYELVRRSEASWLIRRQTALDVLTNRNRRRDLVCSGIERFELASFMDGVRQAPRPGPVADAAFAAGSGDSNADTQNVSAPGDQARLGDAEQASADEPNARNDDPQRCILVNGLMFYPRYAPAWARNREDQSSAQAAEPNDRSATAVEATDDDGNDKANAHANPGQTGANQTPSKADDGTTGRIVWRLRVWTGDAARPDYDRMVRAEGTGAGL